MYSVPGLERPLSPAINRRKSAKSKMASVYAPVIRSDRYAINSRDNGLSVVLPSLCRSDALSHEDHV